MNAISVASCANMWCLFVFVWIFLLLWFIAMCSCAKWIMQGLLDWATLLELNTSVLLHNQESQRCDFAASSVFLSSLYFCCLYTLLYITYTSSYTFPLLLPCHCLCHFNTLSAHDMSVKHSCHFYHVSHSHAVWFSSIHWMPPITIKRSHFHHINHGPQ